MNANKLPSYCLILSVALLLPLAFFAIPTMIVDHYASYRYSLLNNVFTFFTAGCLAALLLGFFKGFSAAKGILYSLPSFIFIGFLGHSFRPLPSGMGPLSLFTASYPDPAGAFSAMIKSNESILSNFKPYIGAVTEMFMGMVFVMLAVLIIQLIQKKQTIEKKDWFRPSYLIWLFLPLVLGSLDFFISYFWAKSRIFVRGQSNSSKMLTVVTIIFILCVVIVFFIGKTHVASNNVKLNTIAVSGTVLAILLFIILVYFPLFSDIGKLPFLSNILHTSLGFPFVFAVTYGAIAGIMLSMIRITKRASY